MPPAGFEPTISAGERPQTYALDRVATGTGIIIIIINAYYNCVINSQYNYHEEDVGSYWMTLRKGEDTLI